MPAPQTGGSNEAARLQQPQDEARRPSDWFSTGATDGAMRRATHTRRAVEAKGPRGGQKAPDPQPRGSGALLLRPPDEVGGQEALDSMLRSRL